MRGWLEWAQGKGVFRGVQQTGKHEGKINALRTKKIRYRIYDRYG